MVDRLLEERRYMPDRPEDQAMPHKVCRPSIEGCCRLVPAHEAVMEDSLEPGRRRGGPFQGVEGQAGGVTCSQ